MDGALIFGFGLLAFGSVLIRISWMLWKTRESGSISILEASLLKLTGAEPLPLTKVDRWLHFFQMLMYGVLGVLISGVAVYGLLEEFGIL
jgi:membrane protein required for beta-lactamase induction